VTTTDVPSDNTSTANIRGDNDIMYTIKIRKAQHDLGISRDISRNYLSYFTSISSGKTTKRHLEAEEVVFAVINRNKNVESLCYKNCNYDIRLTI